MRQLVQMLLLLIATQRAFGVEPLRVTATDPVLVERNWTAFDRSSGLVGQVLDLFEDRDGRIWLGNGRGAQFYDGYVWESFDIGSRVGAITQDVDGAMWFGAMAPVRLVRYDGNDWTTIGLDDSLTTGLTWNALLPARDGSLWGGLCNVGLRVSRGVADLDLPGGIGRFDGNQWEMVAMPVGPPRPNVNHIIQTRDGALWFATEEGVLRYDGATWTRYTSRDGLAGDRVGQILEAADGSLWFACYKGLSRFDGASWRRFAMRHGLERSIEMHSVWQTADGAIWASGSPGVLSRFDGVRWQTYTRDQIPPDGQLKGWPAQDGSIWIFGWAKPRVFRLDSQGPWTVYGHREGLGGGFEATDGSVWFHTLRRAVRLRDGGWTAYGPEDGFADGEVWGLHQVRDGSLFFIGTHRGASAITRFDGESWRVYTAADGAIDSVHQTHPTRTVAANFRSAVLQAQDGAYWFAGRHGEGAALARFDGEVWRRYTVADGLVGQWASAVYQTGDGAIWASTYDPYSLQGQVGHGLFRFDGAAWQRHREVDGLGNDYVTGIAEWPQGTLWAGGLDGLSRLAAGRWWSKGDFEVPAPKIRSLLPTPEGLWFGFLPNRRAGVGRFDGEEWQRFTELDGLAGDGVSDIVRAADGALWFAAQKGVSRYDGETWIGYGEADGLSLGWIFPTLHPARDGSIWIDCSALETGEMKVARLRFPTDRSSPRAELEPTPKEVSARGNILLRWSGRDRWAHTPAAELRYQWRLDGGEWSAWSERRDHTFVELKNGEYRFEVRAMDREGNVEGTPVAHVFAVDPPWWKNPPVVLLMLFLVGLAGLQTQRYLVANSKFQEAQARLIAELEQELETAHALQMGLMPDASPQIAGYDIAGVCRPATHVGGDFFQYYEREGKLSVCLADVTGHAMEAAIPMVQFASILEVQMEREVEVAALFARLNDSMHRALTKRTFVCFTMGKLDPVRRHLRLSNGGCPYPYHFRVATGEVEELQIDAYPLGVRAGADYEVVEVELEPGDRIVFCSDGIVEAGNGEGKIFGFESAEEAIRLGCLEGLSAAELAARLMAKVDAFSGAEPQGDDQTVVVLRVE